MARKGQWFGGAVLQSIKAGTELADVIQILPGASALESIRDLVFERVVIGFQTRRILTGNIEGYGFTLWHGSLSAAAGVVMDPVDPNSLDSFVWADKRIMQVGRLKVPPVLINGFTGATVLPAELTAEEVDIGVKRSVNRATEGVFLRVAADLSDAVKCFITWRAYYMYA